MVRLSQPRWVVLVDCNNFFASCERLFRPDLANKPVAVLSNNDGCIIARSAEVKKLGIPMGAPWFQVRDLIKKHGIHIFSGNHELYADIHKRVMNTLGFLCAEVEVYSIDEAFLHISCTEQEVAELAKAIKERVGKWVGIPVSVGVAPTKTLAKLAMEYAKGKPELEGTFCMSDLNIWEPVLADIPIEDVWGIGRRLAPKLRQMRIRTAFDLAKAHPAAVRTKFGVVVERVLRELQGYSCYEDQGLVESRKQIMCSRSYGEKVKEYRYFHEATCAFVEKAAMRLRRAGELCSSVTVFGKSMIGVNEYGRPYYQHTHACGTLDYPTSDTRILIELAARLAKEAWVEGLTYCKSGVLLSDFSDPGMVQLTFKPEHKNPNSDQLMQTLDRMKRHGVNIHFAGQGIKKPWAAKTSLLSPRYTTRWGDLPVARA